MCLSAYAIHIPQTSARQPGAVKDAAWAISQCTPALADKTLDLTSLSLSVLTSEGCYEDSGWHVRSVIVITVTILYQQDCRLPGSPRSVRAEVPKPGCAIETAGEFGKISQCLCFPTLQRF